MSNTIFNPFDFLKAYTGLPGLMMASGNKVDDVNMKALHDIGGPMLDLWRVFGDNKGTVSDGKQQIFSNMMEQARLFNLFGKQLLQLIKDGSHSKSSTSSKEKYRKIEDFFDQLKTAFSQQRASMTAAIQQLSNMTQFFCDRSATQDAFSASAPFMPYGIVQQFFGKVFSTPTIGYTRETQEQLQEGGRLLTAYFKALDAFTNAYGAFEAKTLNRLQSRLIELAKKKKEISTLKQLYVVWVDTHQEAYAKFISSKKYSHLYGELANSFMRYKRHNQEYADALLKAMNIPTRNSMDTVIYRQQKSGQALQGAQRELKENRARIEQLEKQLETITETLRQLSPAGQKKPTRTRRPASTKKKTAKTTTTTKR